MPDCLELYFFQIYNTEKRRARPRPDFRPSTIGRGWRAPPLPAAAVSILGPPRSAVVPRREARARSHAAHPTTRGHAAVSFIGERPRRGPRRPRGRSVWGDAGRTLPCGRGFVPWVNDSGICTPTPPPSPCAHPTCAPIHGISRTPPRPCLVPDCPPACALRLCCPPCPLAAECSSPTAAGALRAAVPAGVLLHSERGPRAAAVPRCRRALSPPPVSPLCPSGGRLPSSRLQGVVAATWNLRRGVPLGRGATTTPHPRSLTLLIPLSLGFTLALR